MITIWNRIKKLCATYSPWQQNHHQKKIDDCIGTNRQGRCSKLEDTCTVMNEANELDEGAPTCWICLGADPDEMGQPLRRDCSCRGSSAGFAHLSCISQYAEHNSKEARSYWKFSQPWMKCTHCRQSYQNELAVELASNFKAFAMRQYPNNQMLHLEAMYQRLRTLVRANNEEAEEAASQIISLVEHLRSDLNTSIPKRAKSIEAGTYNDIGLFALEKGTQVSANAALVLLRRSRDLCIEIGNVECRLYAEANISRAKAMCDRDFSFNINDRLKQCVELYKVSSRSKGEEAPTTIRIGLDIAEILHETNQRIRAERMVTQLAISSRRVHGPDHNVTREADILLKHTKARYVKLKLKEWHGMKALQYDGENCIVQTYSR